jgi:hypothetical protein
MNFLTLEEFCLLGYKNKKNSACYLFHAGLLLGLFFNPEDGSDMFLSSVG